MSSPLSSEIFTLIALLVLSLLALLILRYYLPLRTTPAYLLVPVFFALWLPAGIILLFPIDLASSNRPDLSDAAPLDPLDPLDPADPGPIAAIASGIWLPDRLILVWWRITYWLTFVMTWFLLPILAEYADAGYREPKDKLLYSLRSNGQYNAIVFGSGMLGLVYFFITSGFSFESFKGVLMALAYCWGLVLVIYLMGHGLVSIPRRLFRHSSVPGRLRRLQAHAPRAYEKMEDAIIEVEDIEQQVWELSRRKTGSARDFSDWIEELVDLANLPESRPRSTLSARLGAEDEEGGRQRRTVPTVITEKYLAELTRLLVRARHSKSRYVGEWNHLLQKAVETQAVLDSNASKRLTFGNPSDVSTWWDRITLLNPYARYILHYHIIPYLSIGAGAILSICSVLILWSELVKVFFPQASVIRLTVVHHWSGSTGQVGLAGQIIAALWLLYMSAATLISVTEVKVWRGRALVRRNTAHESAFWYSMQIAKLSVPLSYNFMTFLSPDIYKKTVFYDFLGESLDLTPLGKWFDILFPVAIIVPVAATAFGLYGKVKVWAGFGDLVSLGDEEDDGEGGNESGFGTGGWREGRDLIWREVSGNSGRGGRGLGIESAAAGQGERVRSAPVLRVPGRRTDSTSPRPGAPGARGGAAELARRQAAVASAAGGSGNGSGPRPRRDVGGEEDDENFFTSFGHRVKNTFDTLDTPQWLQDLGDGIKKPKWMDGDDAGGEGSSGARRDNTDFRRWFGGGGDGQGRSGGGGQGRIRL